MLYTNRYTVSGPGLGNFSFPDDTALMVVGDSHGQSTTLRGLLDGLGRFVTPGKRRHLVFLGDFVDRGPDSLGCLQAAFHEAAERTGADEVTYLPGNHELLMVDAMEAARDGLNMGSRTPAECWGRNGGFDFLVEVFDEMDAVMPNDAREMVKKFTAHIDALTPGDMAFTDFVRSWPSHLKLGDVLCVHAGLAPKKPHEHTFSLTQKEHFPATIQDRDLSQRHWAWIRDAFLAWQGGWPECGSKNADGVLVLHGHTVPAGARASKLEHGEDVRDVFCRMQTNARICLDGGAAQSAGVAGAMVTSDGVRVAWNAC